MTRSGAALLVCLIALVALLPLAAEEVPVPPVISNATPDRLAIDDIVTILGSRFGTEVEDVVVNIPGTTGVVPTSIQDDRITAVIPAGAESGMLTVTRTWTLQSGQTVPLTSNWKLIMVIVPSATVSYTNTEGQTFFLSSNSDALHGDSGPYTRYLLEHRDWNQHLAKYRLNIRNSSGQTDLAFEGDSTQYDWVGNSTIAALDAVRGRLVVPVTSTLAACGTSQDNAISLVEPWANPPATLVTYCRNSASGWFVEYFDFDYAGNLLLFGETWEDGVGKICVWRFPPGVTIELDPNNAYALTKPPIPTAGTFWGVPAIGTDNSVFFVYDIGWNLPAQLGAISPPPSTGLAVHSLEPCAGPGLRCGTPWLIAADCAGNAYAVNTEMSSPPWSVYRVPGQGDAVAFLAPQPTSSTVDGIAMDGYANLFFGHGSRYFQWVEPAMLDHHFFQSLSCASLAVQTPPTCGAEPSLDNNGGTGMGPGGVPIATGRGIPPLRRDASKDDRALDTTPDFPSAPVWSESPIAGHLAPGLFYNGNNIESGPLGPAWFSDYVQTLRPSGEDRLVWTDSLGLRITFGWSELNLRYEAIDPGTAHAWAVEDPGAQELVITKPDGVSHAFSVATGYWVRTTDRWGSGARSTTPLGKPQGVEQLLGGQLTGRSIQLVYDQTETRLASIVDAAGHTTAFGYDGYGRLETICTADQTCPSATPFRRFSYDGDSLRLSRVYDAGGSVIRGWSYNGSGGVASTWVGSDDYATGEERATFLQSSDSTVLVSRQKGDGNTADTTYTVAPVGGLHRVTAIDGACTECGAQNSSTQFDGYGYPLSKQDGAGGVVKRTYDSYGNVLTIVEEEGTSLERTTTFTYADSESTAIPESWRGKVLDFWIAKHEPSVAKPGSEIVTTRTWFGLVLTETVSGYLSADDPSPTSRSTTTTYDTYGRVVLVDGPRTDVSDVTTYQYYALVRPAIPNRGRLLKRVDPDGTDTRFTAYDALGNLLSSKRLARASASDVDVVTDREYDVRGRLTKEILRATAASENDISYESHYDSRGRLDQTIVRDGSGPTSPIVSVTDMTYENGTDRLLTRTVAAVTGGAGDRVTYGHDEPGNVTSETYGRFDGSTTTTDYSVNRTFDGGCKVRTVTYPADGATTKYDYDCAGRLRHVTDAMHTQANTDYDLDGLGRISQITRHASPTNDITTMSYDAGDHLTEVVDANLNPTRYTYDDFGSLRKKETTLSGGGLGDVTTYTYDAAGNVSTVQQHDRTVVRQYDAAGRLLSVSATGASSPVAMSYAYDTGCLTDPTTGLKFGQGRLCSVTDPSGTRTLGYDRRGLIVTERLSLTGAPTAYEPFVYAYDAAGRRTRTAYPNGDAVVASLGPAGRPTVLRQEYGAPPTGRDLLTQIEHRAFGPVSGYTAYSGVAESRSFNSRYLRTSQATTSGGNTLLGLNYATYDLEGNLKVLNDTAPGGWTFGQTFTYDADRYFLTGAAGSYGPLHGFELLGWTYDKTGNRLTEQRLGVIEEIRPPSPQTFAGSTYSYGDDGAGHSNGVLTSITTFGVESLIAHLPTGDLSYTHGESSTLRTDFSYDALGRLYQTDQPPTCQECDGPRDTYLHDSGGRRVVKTVRPGGPIDPSAVTKEHFLYGSDGVLYAWLKLNSSGTPIDSEYYVWLEGEPVTILKGSNQAWMLHNDHLGRPIGMTAPDGTLAWRGEFEPFGVALAPRVSTAGFEPRFRFPGQWEGGDLGGLVDNHFRSYMPAWGRYSQADPMGLGAGINLFQYADANPVGAIDPLGLCCTAMDRFRDLQQALQIADTKRDGTLLSQFCSGKIFDLGAGGCGYNADGLAREMNKELDCYSARRIDTGPQRLFPGVFEYSAIIPHSFVALKAKDPCAPCEELPEVFIDNYSGLTTMGFLP